MIKVTQTHRWSFEKLQEQLLPYFGSLRFFLPLKRRIKWKFVFVKKPFVGEGSGSIFQLFFLVGLPPQQHWQCRWTLSPSQDVPVWRSRSCRVISAMSMSTLSMSTMSMSTMSMSFMCRCADHALVEWSQLIQSIFADSQLHGQNVHVARSSTFTRIANARSRNWS